MVGVAAVQVPNHAGWPQVEAREGQATTREAEHERRLKELASRQRQFFQREKEAKAQEV